jgi:hypothetical protein
MVVVVLVLGHQVAVIQKNRAGSRSLHQLQDPWGLSVE